MRKKFSVALVALMALTLFACGKKTDTKPTDTKPSSTDDTTKEVIKQYDVSVVSKIVNMPDADVTKAGTITGTGKVEEGKSTTLTATPNTGFTFLGFFANETDTTPLNGAGTYTYTVSNVKAAQTFYAKWQANSYTLTVLNSDDTRGTITYEEKESYLTGEVITLTAEPETGSQFNGWWLGDTECISTDEVFEYSMYGANTTITGRFGIKKCTIELVANIEEAVDELTIYTDLNGEKFNEPAIADYGTDVNIYINAANAGYSFLGFYEYREDGDYSTSTLLDADYHFTATDSIKYLAYFEANNYDLFVEENIDAAGSYIGVYKEAEYTEDDIEGGFSVVYKTSITLTATAEDGYTFIGWYSDENFENQITTDATYTYAMNVAGDNYIYAKYVANDIKINFATPENGTINVESGVYAYNSSIDLIATPNNGYIFDGWYIGENKISSDSEYTYLVDVTLETTITAKFVKGVYNIDSYINLEGLDEDVYDEFYSLNDNDYEYLSQVTLTAKTMPGYTFVGWYFGEIAEGDDYSTNELISNELICSFEMFGENKIVTACYERNVYRITYTKGAGESISKLYTDVKYGLISTLLIPTTSVAGQVFEGWQYADENGDFVNLTDSQGVMLEKYAFTEGITVYSSWDARDLKVTFDTDGGSDVAEQTVVYNNAIVKPADPTKEGYTFVGWFNSENQAWVFSSAIISDTTLYAHWTINQYTIAIESQDDSIVEVDDSINGTYDYNTPLKLSASIITGYTFDGWFDGETLISSDLMYNYNVPAKNIEIVAKYHINQYNVTVTLKQYYNYVDLDDFAVTGGGTFDYNSTITISTTFNHAACKIQMYRANINGSWEYIKDGSTYITTNPYVFTLPDRDVEIQIYVHYNYKYLKVVKDVSEGTAPYFKWYSSSSQYTNIGIYYNSPCSLFAYEIEGYDFVGWYNGDELISEELENVLFTMPYEAVTLTAKYEPIEYTLTINKNVNDHKDDTADITNIQTLDVAYHDTYETTVETMTGYTFKGWYLNGELISSDASLTYEMPHEDTTIEARYEINTYTLYTEMYISNTDYNLTPGGINVGDSSEYDYDYNTEVEYVATTNPGWTFLGYYGLTGGYHDFDREELANGDYELLSTEATYTFTMVNDDYIIYPVWKANTYILQYYANGGTIPGGAVGAEVLFGDNYELAVPTKTGETFVGWYYAKGLNKIYLTDENGVSLGLFDYAFTGEALNIQAEYGVTLHTVTFETGYTEATYDSNDTKTYTVKVPYGSKVPVQDNPIRKGYTFNGWFTEEVGGTEWTFDTNTILENTTLYAHWTVNQYTIQLRMGGIGTNMAKFTYYVNSTINGTVSNTTGVTLTLDYGTVITLDTTLYLGRKVGSWTYSYSGTSSWIGVSTLADFDFVFKYDQNIYLACNIESVDEMSYYIFTSTETTCQITGLSSTGKAATSLVVPEYVTGINMAAFSGNTVLTDLTLPFTGLSRTSTATAGKTFAIIFGTTSGDGLRETQPYYMNGTTRTAASKRYLPNTLKNVTITDETVIADCAFDNMGLNKIALEEGVTTLGSYAIANNKISYSSLLMPSTLTTINDHALYHFSTSYISNFVVPNSVTYIGKEAFGYTAIAKITLPFIGSGYDATGEESLFNWIWSASWGVSCNQKYANESTVNGYVSSYLNTIIIAPTKAGYVPKYGSLMNLTKVTNITINFVGTTNVIISDYLFANDTALTSLDGSLIDNARRICSHAFENCSSLGKSIVSGEEVYDFSLTNINIIETYAFAGSSINSVSGTFARIEDYAFSNCSQLESIKSTSNSDIYILHHCFDGCTKLSNVDITVGKTKYIGDYAFNNCSSLTDLDCLEGCVFNSLRSYAFANCTSLASIGLFDFDPSKASNGGNWNKIGDYAFLNCTSLTTLVLPKNTLEFGANILEGCKSLISLTIPYVGKDSNVTTGGATYNSHTINANYIFGYYFGTEAQDTSSFYTAAQYVDASTTANYYIPSSLENVTITNVNNVIPAYSFYHISVKKLVITGKASTTYDIGTNAFRYSRINSVTFASGLKRVYNYAFYDLWIKQLELPNTIGLIGNYAFANNTFTSTYTLEFPSSSSLEIGSYAFNSNNFGTVIFNRYQTIMSNAFRGCQNLTSVQFKYVATPTNNGTVQSKAFYGCTNQSMVISYAGTKDQFTALVSAGKFVSGWNIITDASGSTAAVIKNTVSCSDGLLNL